MLVHKLCSFPANKSLFFVKNFYFVITTMTTSLRLINITVFTITYTIYWLTLVWYFFFFYAFGFLKSFNRSFNNYRFHKTRISFVISFFICIFCYLFRLIYSASILLQCFITKYRLRLAFLFEQITSFNKLWLWTLSIFWSIIVFVTFLYNHLKPI